MYKESYNILYRKARIEHWKVCLYGLGQIGSYGEEVLSYIGFKPDFVCDRDENRIKSFGINEVQGINVEELLRYKEDILVFVMLGFTKTESAEKILKKNKKLHIVTWVKELLVNEEVIKRFFKLKELPKMKERKVLRQKNEEKHGFLQKGKIAVYTCITGGYETEYLSPTWFDGNCDFFCITDGILKIGEKVQKIDVDSVVPQSVLGAKAKNRYCKMNGYKIFSEYDYSIYIDGNDRVIGKISEMINKIGPLGVAFYKRKYAMGVYDELMSIVVSGRVDRKLATEFAKELTEKNIYFNMNIPLGGIVVCKNKNENAIKILKEWEANYCEGKIKRDMLYFPDIIKKQIMENKELCTLGDLDMTKRGNEYLYIEHAHRGCQE